MAVAESVPFPDDFIKKCTVKQKQAVIAEKGKFLFVQRAQGISIAMKEIKPPSSCCVFHGQGEGKKTKTRMWKDD